MRFLYKLIFDRQPASFASAYDVDEAVRRLSAAVSKPSWHSPFKQGVVGTVERDRVVLWRVIPFYGNPFAPRFYGKFHVRDGVTVLEGYFTMPLFIKICTAVWFGLVFIGAVITLISTVSQLIRAPGTFQQADWLWVIPFAMLLLGVALLQLSKWLARHDPAFLAARIRSALSK